MGPLVRRGINVSCVCTGGPIQLHYPSRYLILHFPPDCVTVNASVHQCCETRINLRRKLDNLKKGTIFEKGLCMYRGRMTSDHAFQEHIVFGSSQVSQQANGRKDLVLRVRLGRTRKLSASARFQAGPLNLSVPFSRLFC